MLKRRQDSEGRVHVCRTGATTGVEAEVAPFPASTTRKPCDVPEIHRKPSGTWFPLSGSSDCGHVGSPNGAHDVFASTERQDRGQDGDERFTRTLEGEGAHASTAVRARHAFSLVCRCRRGSPPAGLHKRVEKRLCG